MKWLKSIQIGLSSPDQYSHPPTVDREGKKKDEEQIHHYYLSCVQIQILT